MPKTVILGAARTPFGEDGRRRSSSLDATELGGNAIDAALERADVDAGAGREGRLRAGAAGRPGTDPLAAGADHGRHPKEVPSETVNKVCASGMRIGRPARPGDPRRRPRARPSPAAWRSCRTPPTCSPAPASASGWATSTPIDAMTHDGLTNPFTGKHMINEASEVATSSRSPARTWTAARPAPTSSPPRRPTRVVSPRRSSRSRSSPGRPRRLSRSTRRSAPTPPSRRSPSCRRSAATTRPTPPATRPGVNDGAGALVVASDEWAKRERPARRSRRSSPTAAVADDFAYLARTPAKAAQLALEKAGKTAEDVDLWEINEAFASVAINSVRMLGIDEEKVNVNGGAIALGHPIGASGGRIIGTLVHELRRRGGGLGCAAICCGGGQGDAILIEV